VTDATPKPSHRTVVYGPHGEERWQLPAACWYCHEPIKLLRQLARVFPEGHLGGAVAHRVCRDAWRSTDRPRRWPARVTT
jgi:hypothetical protein